MPFVRHLGKTNMLTHIPEDIKLELKNGVLTLKAGSKVYIPNGFEKLKKYYKDVVTTKYWKEITTGSKELEYYCYYKTHTNVYSGYMYVDANLNKVMGKEGEQFTFVKVASSSELNKDMTAVCRNITSESIEVNVGVLSAIWEKYPRYTAGDLYKDTTKTETIEGTPEDYTYTTEEIETVEVTADDDWNRVEEIDTEVKKFDVVTIDQDKVYSSTSTTSYESLFGWTEDKQSFWFNADNLVISGSTPSTTSGGTYWYDTKNNLIKRYANSTWNVERHSLPLGRFTRESGKPAKINQVFNGFGYIGSTVYALPGVKGLIPDGKNLDGTLKNIEYMLDSVKTFTYDSTNTFTNLTFGIRETGGLTSYTTYKYDAINNYNTNQTGRWDVLIYATGDVTSGAITSFTPKKVGEGYVKNKFYSLVKNNRAYEPYFAKYETVSQTFSVGNLQTYIVPENVTKLNVVCSASRGANSEDGSILGGSGGSVKCDLSVTPGQTLYITVGGIPSSAGTPSYNASDIRINGTNYANRIIVAGGGGSAAWRRGTGTGGKGGGLTGGAGKDQDYAHAGKGGTQSAGGAGGSVDTVTSQWSSVGKAGSLGMGGASDNHSNHYAIGGCGGAGYYGGGGGGGMHTDSYNKAAGGGGGSSYTDNTLCSNVVHTQGLIGGSGYVKISYKKELRK